MRIRSVIFTILAGIAILAFQNCGKVQFDSRRNDISGILNVSSVDSASRQDLNSNSESNIVPLEPNPNSVLKPNGNEMDVNLKILGCTGDGIADRAALANSYPTELSGGIFGDLSNLVGQDWRFSNKMRVQSEGILEVWSKMPNAGYSLNGVLNSLELKAAPCGMYYAQIKVYPNDEISLAMVSFVWGGVNRWVTYALNGEIGAWEIKTKDYTIIGGHNAAASVSGGLVNGKPKSYRCSGSVVRRTVEGNWASEGACVDFAQRDPAILCGEIDSSKNECRLFDGPPLKDGVDLSISVVIFEPLADFLARY
jgi:hypothetical protein